MVKRKFQHNTCLLHKHLDDIRTDNLVTLSFDLKTRYMVLVVCLMPGDVKEKILIFKYTFLLSNSIYKCFPHYTVK